MPWWKRSRPEPSARTAAADEGVDVPLRAARAGDLPDGDTAAVDGTELPAGRTFHNDPMYSDDGAGEATARGWLSDDVVAGVEQRWWELAERFDDTGLWPLLTNGLGGDLDRPWRDGELGNPAAPSAVTAEAFLERAWTDGTDHEDAVWPGLATGTPDDSGRVRLPRPLGLPPSAGLLLVPATRPADVLSALGWLGAANYDYDAAEMSAVLRSWEERFGAVPVCLDFDVLTMAVARPPSEPADVQRLAHEHYAFCPDNVDQGAGTVERYAQGLAGARQWTFWWD